MTSIESSMEIVFDSLSDRELREYEKHINYLPQILDDRDLLGVAPVKTAAGSGLLTFTDNHVWFLLRFWGSVQTNWDCVAGDLTSAHLAAGKLALTKKKGFNKQLTAEFIGNLLPIPFLDTFSHHYNLTREVGEEARLSNRIEWQDGGEAGRLKMDAIDRALKSLSVFDAQALAKGEIKELPNILWEDELPIAVITGFYHGGNGILVTTDRRLIFIDKGIVGLTVEDIYFEDISSIESHQGLISGSLTIYARGNKETITYVEKESVRPFSDLLRNELAKSKQMKVDMGAQTQQAVSTPARVDNIDALFKLAELHKMGVLTDEELAEQKAKLLM